MREARRQGTRHRTVVPGVLPSDGLAVAVVGALARSGADHADGGPVREARRQGTRHRTVVPGVLPSDGLAVAVVGALARSGADHALAQLVQIGGGRRPGCDVDAAPQGEEPALDVR